MVDRNQRGREPVDSVALLVVLFVVVTWRLFSPLRLPGRRHTGWRVVGPSRPA